MEKFIQKNLVAIIIIIIAFLVPVLYFNKGFFKSDFSEDEIKITKELIVLFDEAKKLEKETKAGPANQDFPHYSVEFEQFTEDNIKEFNFPKIEEREKNDEEYKKFREAMDLQARKLNTWKIKIQDALVLSKSLNEIVNIGSDNENRKILKDYTKKVIDFWQTEEIYQTSKHCYRGYLPAQIAVCEMSSGSRDTDSNIGVKRESDLITIEAIHNKLKSLKEFR